MSGGADERRSGVDRQGSLLGPRSFVVDHAADGQRLDAIVGKALGVSAAAARRLIDQGLVRVDQREAAKGARVGEGARVEIASHVDPATPVVADDPAALVLLHEDPHLIAMNKPAGMPSHPMRAGERGTAANMIVARFPECAAASLDPREGGLAHRLDTATSGVLIAARSRAAWTALRGILGAGGCEKLYLCEVRGQPAASGHIDSEIGRHGRRGRAVRVGGGRRPQPAETDWVLVARGAATSLVQARLHAGRPHQVRAHLAAAGFPIVGDDRYGASPTGDSTAAEPGPGLRLHALSVRFRHPLTDAELLIEAPPPSWANQTLFR